MIQSSPDKLDTLLRTQTEIVANRKTIIGTQRKRPPGFIRRAFWLQGSSAAEWAAGR